jgi:hypothetical protein
MSELSLITSSVCDAVKDTARAVKRGSVDKDSLDTLLLGTPLGEPIRLDCLRSNMVYESCVVLIEKVSNNEIRFTHFNNDNNEMHEVIMSWKQYKLLIDQLETIVDVVLN